MIDKDKTYRTRDGREVRIYTTDAGGIYPVHGAFKDPDGEWALEAWTLSGLFIRGEEDDLDLIEVKPKRIYERWVNVYENGYESEWATRACADVMAANYSSRMRRIACLHIRHEYEDGEGL